MTSTWYVGPADIRRITIADWNALGVTGASTTQWDKFNGWSINESTLNAGQLAWLAADSLFRVNQADTPRPGASVISNPYEKPTIADITRLIQSQGFATPSQVGQLVTAALAANPTVATAAAAAVSTALDTASIPKAEYRSDRKWGVKFDDASVFVEADETNGLTSKVARMTPKYIPEESGWSFLLSHSNGVGIWGIRTNGEVVNFKPPAVTPVLSSVVLNGDSLLAGYGTMLAGPLGRTIVNQGIGGQGCQGIAARQGGHPALLTLNGGKIPAAVGSVSVTAYDVDILGGPADATRTMVGSISGVPGTLTCVQSGASRTYTFTRTTAGAVVPVPAQTPFVTGLAYRDHFPIIGMGRNSLATLTADQIVQYVRDVLHYTTRPSRALVLSVPPSTADTQATIDKINLVNLALKTNFGSNYVDWSGYLRSDEVMASVGLTPTTTDLANIAAGLTPESFRNAGDGLHFNTIAYTALNALFVSEYNARGWTS